MSVLSANQLSVNAWGNYLLKDISLHVDAGELVAILGPNGAGKTTLLNALSGHLTEEYQSSGDIMLCGCSLQNWLIAEKARHVALLPQLSLLNFPYTVDEVVQLARTPHDTGVAIDRQIVDQALQALDIKHLRQRFYTQLSGGEKQRVQLARVMAQIWRKDDAVQRVLLLDEPSSSLDLGHQQQLMHAIRQFANDGVAIVMIAHDINLVAQHADRLVALYQGKLVAYGAPVETISSVLIKDLYGVDVDIIMHPSTRKPLVVARNYQELSGL